jgi:hypothetical protein
MPSGLGKKIEKAAVDKANGMEAASSNEIVTGS